MTNFQPVFEEQDLTGDTFQLWERNLDDLGSNFDLVATMFEKDGEMIEVFVNGRRLLNNLKAYYGEKP